MTLQLLTLILDRLQDAVVRFANRRGLPYVVWLGNTRYVGITRPDPLPPLPRETWLLLRHRLARLAERLCTLFQRWQQGALPRPRFDFPRPRRAPRPRPATPYPRLPRGRAWVSARIFDTRACGTQLEHLVAQPEFQRFLSEAPQAGRLLRPLLHMLGRPLPPGLARPRLPRLPRPRLPRPQPREPDRPLPPYVRAAAKAWKKFG